MTQRSKLELPVNQPITIELLFDEPISGTSKYGSYYMYAVIAEGKEYSFFPPEEIHEQLKPLKKGDKAVITKLAAQRGNKLVTALDVKIESKQSLKQNNDFAQQEEESINKGDNASSKTNDNLYNIMLHCYQDALELQKELNGLADPEKIAVTLFIARSKNL